MLHKDPLQRIEMIEIFEHPWIQKYKKRAEHWSDDEESTPSESLEQENNDTESIDSSMTIPKSRKQTTKKVMELFNIAENDNETTGNYVNINLKQKMQEMELLEQQKKL